MNLPHTLNGNRILKKLDFDLLYTKYNNHRRLQVFAKKGTSCVRCGVDGVYLLKSVDRGDGYHIDLYTANFVLMTIDHIIPKSRGGASALSNYQPMCQHCNGLKGNTLEGAEL
ncbi:HNH endonuclease [Spirosoma endophyticum]|uniref:HNH endonuclease n=1 Tax=Spirosoma endophyticum TaxID=662367 RepID=A0A1I1MZG4_9BACT|nr:HNH endonuclease [Spirosoma endophyticum]SFC90486.1 HNH endonuclease [Spirosoma endophyticum]